MVLRSPLYDIQKELGAKFTEFAGFEMPIQYSSIKDEHLTVRKSVGLFDVSHMSNVWLCQLKRHLFLQVKMLKN